MIEVRLEPMTEAQYAAYRSAGEADYAQSIADSGLLPEVEARQKAADDFAKLLPDGLRTVGHHLWNAYDGDTAIGMLWIRIEEKSDGPHAFGFDFSVREEVRRHGYGRAIIVAAEKVCRELGVVSIELNVFGPNVAARTLYEQMGFEVTAVQMRKLL
jgi:GNAT superfamily N-acetyltransferase